MVYVPPCNCPTTSAGTPAHLPGCFMLPVAPREETPYPGDLIHSLRAQVDALTAALAEARRERDDARALLLKIDARESSAMYQRCLDCDFPKVCEKSRRCESMERMGGTETQREIRRHLSGGKGGVA